MLLKWPQTRLELVAVESVVPIACAKPGQTRWVIKGRTVDSPPVRRLWQTFRDLEAALCDQVKGSTTHVWITWKRNDTWRSNDIVKVELDTTAWSASR